LRAAVGAVLAHADHQPPLRRVERRDQVAYLGLVARRGAQEDLVVHARKRAARFDEGSDLRQQLLGAAMPEADDLQRLAPGQGAEQEQCKEEPFHKRVS
jgi:hypothetical protein